MIRLLLLAFCLTGFVRAGETTLTDLVPGLSADEFDKRKAAMEKIEAYAEKNPQKIIEELPPILRELKDPESSLRLRKIAKVLLGLQTKRALFGFTFSLNKNSEFKDKPVTGVFITFVRSGSGAEKAGLKIRDTILAIDGKPFPRELSEDKIRDIFARQEPGKKVTLSVLRLGKVMQIPATPRLEDYPPEIVEERRRKFNEWLHGPPNKGPEKQAP